MAKIFYFDVETTGLSPVKNSIHQLAGIIEIDGQVTDEFNIKMQPVEMDQLPEDYVTPVGGITKADFRTYGTQEEGYKLLMSKLNTSIDRFDRQDKFFISGYNCQNFDMNFLRKLFDNHQNSFIPAYFWSSSLDVMVLAANALIETRKTMPNFKLETVAKQFGIEIQGKGFHDAMSDIRATREIYQILQIL